MKYDFRIEVKEEADGKLKCAMVSQAPILPSHIKLYLANWFLGGVKAMWDGREVRVMLKYKDEE